LLVGPQVKPKKELSANMRLELRTYFDFNYLATKVFENVWINEELAKRAETIDKQINLKISLEQQICIESKHDKRKRREENVSHDRSSSSRIH
jgi:hypothetical protein